VAENEREFAADALQARGRGLELGVQHDDRPVGFVVGIAQCGDLCQWQPELGEPSDLQQAQEMADPVLLVPL